MLSKHYDIKEFVEKIKDRTLEVSGIQVPVFYFRPYEGEIIWGATARITISLLKVLELYPT